MTKVLKIVIVFTIIFLNLSLLIPSQTHAQADLGGFIINNFDSKIVIKSDYTVDISENINITFNAQRHGIFRFIPLVGEIDDGNGKIIDKRIDININSITQDTKPVNFTTYINHDTNLKLNNKLFGLFYDLLVIQIGDSNQLVNGNIDYQINYTVKNAMIAGSSNKAIFDWGVTGTGWNVPINKASSEVTSDFDSSLNIICASGTVGSTGGACKTNTVNGLTPKFDNTVSASVTSLSAGEGLNISVSSLNSSQNTLLASGTSIKDYTALIIADIFPFLLIFSPLLILLFIFIYWISHKAPKGTGVIVPYYDAPDGLKPAQVGYIYDESIDDVDYGATIIDLAIRGFLKIEYLKESDDYIFHKIAKEGVVTDYEQTFISGLFSSGDIVYLSTLKNTFYKTLQLVKSQLNVWVVSNKYFRTSVDKGATIGMIIVVFTFIFICGTAFNSFLHLGPFYMVAFIAIAILTALPDILLIISLNHKTIQGVLEKEKILGLKKYIELAEKDRINLLNAPQMTPEHFEKLLPYAIVLGMSKEWAKKFENIYTTPPQWYGGDFNTFTTLWLISSLTHATTQFNSVLSSSPSSSGSGYSGGGFGGSVGGGFGGGGGGSW